MQQQIITAENNYEQLDSWIRGTGAGTVMLVCDSSLQFLDIRHYFDSVESRLGITLVRFTDIVPNPSYESVVEGVSLFNSVGCGAIIAVGGGSSMDVAKCIKLHSNMDPAINYLKQEIVPNDIPLLAVPTTAGTGSEATRYAVIYFEGAKQSITSDSIIPSVVLFDHSVLRTLPVYQKKSTMMDALCHATESVWSVNRTDESYGYAREAIGLILSNIGGYLANDDSANHEMLRAANLAGHAINITQTTAGHAMCYKITSLFGSAHGHAAALCDRVLFPWMAEITNPAIVSVMADLASCYGCSSASEAAAKFVSIFDSLGLEVPSATEDELAELCSSVNPVRLKNHPVTLDHETIEMLYRKILNVR